MTVEFAVPNARMLSNTSRTWGGATIQLALYV